MTWLCAQTLNLLTGREGLSGQPVGPGSHDGLGAVLNSAQSGATHGGLASERLHDGCYCGLRIGRRKGPEAFSQGL